MRFHVYNFLFLCSIISLESFVLPTRRLIMKKKYLFALIGMLPLFGMIVSGCSCAQNDTDTTEPDPYVPPEGEPEDPETADDYITAIHMKRTKDFFMQRTEVLDFNVTFDGGGDDSQKEIEWKSSNPNVVKITKNSEHPDLTRYCTLHALKEGSATIVARSLFNTALTCKVSITVIDNSEYTYFWQMGSYSSSSDKAEKNWFVDEDGYPSTEGTVKLGIKDGPTMDWDYKFDQAPEKVGGGQALKFGSKANPFGKLHFEANPGKKIRKFSILCSSAARHIDDGSAYGKSDTVGSSNIKITIGGTTYVDTQPTPKNTNDSTIELDTVTGPTMDENPLEGKIEIDFSETHYDSEANAGAIYIKAIIIEYYRGNLHHIDVTSVNEYNQTFYVEHQFDNSGYEVNAYFKDPDESDPREFNPIPVNVNDSTAYYIQGGNVDENGNFIGANPAQPITASYTYLGVTKDKTFDVKVADRITKIEARTKTENPAPREFLVKAPLDYQDYEIHIDTATEADVQVFDLANIATDQFAACFDTNNVHLYAIKALQSGFRISMVHYLSGLSVGLTIPENQFVIKVVQSIAMEYTGEATTLPLALEEGEELFEHKVDSTNKLSDVIKTTITYDNGSTLVVDKISDFKDNIDQSNPNTAYTYKDTVSGNTLFRFNYIPNSPLVTNKTFVNNGFEIVLKDAVGEAEGKITFAPSDITISYITKIQLRVDTFTKTAYEEATLADYTGLKMDIYYSGAPETPVEKTLAEFSAMKTYLPGTKTSSANKDKGNIVEANTNVALFNFVAPKYTTASMQSEGFSLTATSINDEAITSTLVVPANTFTITPITDKVFTKVTSEDEIKISDTTYNYKYLITSYEGAGYTMKVWNGDLDDDNIVKKFNYFTYGDGTQIGETITTRNPSMIKGLINLTSISEGFYGIRFESGKYFTSGNSTATKTTGKTNNTHWSIKFDESGNALIKNIKVDSSKPADFPFIVTYIVYNSASNSDKIGAYDINNKNLMPIQLYRIAIPKA